MMRWKSPPQAQASNRSIVSDGINTENAVRVRPKLRQRRRLRIGGLKKKKSEPRLGVLPQQILFDSESPVAKLKKPKRPSSIRVTTTQASDTTRQFHQLSVAVNEKGVATVQRSPRSFKTASSSQSSTSTSSTSSQSAPALQQASPRPPRVPSAKKTRPPASLASNKLSPPTIRTQQKIPDDTYSVISSNDDEPYFCDSNENSFTEEYHSEASKNTQLISNRKSSAFNKSPLAQSAKHPTVAPLLLSDSWVSASSEEDSQEAQETGSQSLHHHSWHGSSSSISRNITTRELQLTCSPAQQKKRSHLYKATSQRYWISANDLDTGKVTQRALSLGSSSHSSSHSSFQEPPRRHANIMKTCTPEEKQQVRAMYHEDPPQDKPMRPRRRRGDDDDISVSSIYKNYSLDESDISSIYFDPGQTPTRRDPPIHKALDDSNSRLTTSCALLDDSNNSSHSSFATRMMQELEAQMQRRETLSRLAQRCQDQPPPQDESPPTTWKVSSSSSPRKQTRITATPSPPPREGHSPEGSREKSPKEKVKRKKQTQVPPPPPQPKSQISATFKPQGPPQPEVVRRETPAPQTPQSQKSLPENVTLEMLSPRQPSYDTTLHLLEESRSLIAEIQVFTGQCKGRQPSPRPPTKPLKPSQQELLLRHVVGGELTKKKIPPAPPLYNGANAKAVPPLKLPPLHTTKPPPTPSPRSATADVNS